MGASHCRVAFFSHDTMGLGHMRRNLLLAQALRHSWLHASVLMIAGAREATLVTREGGVDCVALPSLLKDAEGRYHPRHLSIPLAELLALRAKTAHAALDAFDPDALIVDNVPRGAVRELDPVLEWLHAKRRTRLVLGLRDVLDDPATLQGEWAMAENQDAVRHYYDAVWVYGDPTVYDTVREYAFAPDVAAKARYTGYLDRPSRLKTGTDHADVGAALGLKPGRIVLCLVGGGQDGAELADAFLNAELPRGTNGVVLTGPYMPVEVRRGLTRRAARYPGRRRVVTFLREPTRILQRADRVVSMGGYNTVCEILSFGKPSLIVPRVKPRREQLIRAERLQALGLVDLVRPGELSPRTLSEWLARESAPTRPARDRVDLEGLHRVPRLLEDLLNAPFATGPSARPRLLPVMP
ncbi:MAG TPA: glycosyltransferase [Gemmatimonadales bacterium]|nr:glycosyltransferase [Gemmatimonadales bacterium]